MHINSVCDLCIITIKATNQVKILLLLLKEKGNLNKQIFGNKYLQNDYIFKWDKGKPYKPDYISRTFNNILKKCNLPIIRFQDLRHSCASLLVAQGFTIKDIQEWLGHADIQTTANIYAPLDIERKSNIMHTMTDILTL
ncbi:MAG: tyrosine-type recombinase/integrase [Clostridia bacterium]|nr:tyrosine-type recombinase/integrase [Clostridia bacterium]